jgi:hypothetical protein
MRYGSHARVARARTTSISRRNGIRALENWIVISGRKDMQSRHLFKGALLVGFVTFTGCGDSALNPLEQMDSPGLSFQGGMTGSGGINGASPAAYHANVFRLLAALSVAAAHPNERDINSAVISTGLLDTADGREVFEYATRCALPTGTELEYAGNVYSGGGILATTASWISGGLSIAQKEDVLTCMIAHLNAFDVHVPIFLSGPSINSNESADTSGFSVEEAIWQAKIPGPGQAPIYYAWPRANLLNLCQVLSTTTWIQRICGTPVNTCGVQVRLDQAFVCSGGNGRYTCNGKPAIETTLKDGDLCTLLTPPG